MQQANDDAETLRRVDALGDGQLSQALREALARRSDAARVEAMDDDEKFEALQTENVMASNPESLAYFRANKAMMRKRGGKPLRA
mgnify:CR=1 FL=1